MNELPSQFTIGDPVTIRFRGGVNDGAEIHGYVRAVIFTSAKVRYSVLILCGAPEDSLSPEQMREFIEGGEITIDPSSYCFTMHNVDSVLLIEREGPSVRIDGDNYS